MRHPKFKNFLIQTEDGLATYAGRIVKETPTSWLIAGVDTLELWLMGQIFFGLEFEVEKSDSDEVYAARRYFVRRLGELVAEQQRRMGWQTGRPSGIAKAYHDLEQISHG